MKYKVVLEKEGNNGYSVYVPALPGCASQGETVREAMMNIKKAIKLYIWSIKEDKRKLEKARILIKDVAIPS